MPSLNIILTLSVGNRAQSAVSGLKTLQLFSYSNSRLSYLNQQMWRSMFAALFLRSVSVKGYCHLSLVHQTDTDKEETVFIKLEILSLVCLSPCLSFCFTLFQSESHDALSLLSPSISVNVRLSPHLRPRCLYPGSRLFMSWKPTDKCHCLH